MQSIMIAPILCVNHAGQKTKGEVDNDGIVKRRKRNVRGIEKPKRIGSITPQSVKAKKCHHELHELTMN